MEEQMESGHTASRFSIPCWKHPFHIRASWSKNASLLFSLHRISAAAVIGIDILAATGAAHRLK
jgi:hypothetical protein